MWSLLGAGWQRAGQDTADGAHAYAHLIKRLRSLLALLAIPVSNRGEPIERMRMEESRREEVTGKLQSLAKLSYGMG